MTPPRAIIEMQRKAAAARPALLAMPESDFAAMLARVGTLRVKTRYQQIGRAALLDKDDLLCVVLMDAHNRQEHEAMRRRAQERQAQIAQTRTHTPLADAPALRVVPRITKQ
jgi:hypothetical protein